jgi:hypothetical protein
VRLFESVETRTRELARSLEDLRTTQDRLVQTQKLASLGQLTAGIAHEIKNPLNFVNNFSVVSAELIDELHEVLLDAPFPEQKRPEIAELMNTLRTNLGKVVQHSKRADGIVKNMLLHSREGSGEHRTVDINALVEESLNLAYHGARAEKQGFNITLQRSFDATAGEADIFPQEITRVLLNLISNGFYAAPSARRRVPTAMSRYSPPQQEASATAWRSAFAITVPVSRPRLRTRCSIPSSQQSRREKGPASASRSATTSLSNSTAAPSRLTRSPANSPRSGSFCHARRPLLQDIRDGELTDAGTYLPVATWSKSFTLGSGARNKQASYLPARFYIPQMPHPVYSLPVPSPT